MKKLFFILVLSLGIKVYGGDLATKLSVEGDTFSFELLGQSNWDYELKRVNQNGQSKVQLYIKTLSEQSIEKIVNIKNPFVKSIQVIKNAIDNKYLIEFELFGKQVESFDYLTDQPSKLIIDFYKTETAPPKGVAESEVTIVDDKVDLSAIKPSQTKSTDIKVNTEKLAEASQKVRRQPADVDYLRLNDGGEMEPSLLSRSGLFDAGDALFKRFIMRESDYKEESIIKSRNNYYLKFPPLETEFLFWKNMKSNPPSFEVTKVNSDENQQARLLRKLFNKKRYLVFLQTLSWFQKKYPSSEYAELNAYMAGDAFTELWKAEKIDSLYTEAQSAYREAIEKFPDSTLAERTSLFSGMLAVDKADYMSAIRRLHNHAANKRFENKISILYAKLGLAYSYSKINKLDESLKILNEIEKGTQDQTVLTEAAIRKGDFLFHAGKHSEAIEAYNVAIEKYPLVRRSFPSAFFNKMEALFWKEKFKDSHQAALEFAQLFPSNEFAPYALTRVGELLDIMGADQSKSIGAFLETHFRYGDSPKTIVARLHLISTKIKSMKKEELDLTLEKMKELASKSDLKNVDQFKVTMEADGFSRRRDYKRAIDTLSKFFQQNPNRVDSKQVTQRIVRNINDYLYDLTDKKSFPEVLKTYKEYSDTWLKGQNRIDTDYLLGQSYSAAGAYEVSIEKYRKTLNEMNAIRNSPREKEIYINQYLPSFDTLNLKMAHDLYENQQFQEAYQHLEQIQKPLLLSEEDQVKRVQLASSLYDQKGDHATSARYLKELSSFWKGDENLAVPVMFKLAEMQHQNNDIEAATETFEKCKEVVFKQEKRDPVILGKLARNYSDFLLKTNQNERAIEFLTELFQKSDDPSLERERYTLGNLHYMRGEIKKADVVWKELSGASGQIWKKISQEKLNQAAWDVEYKKHLKRIPAMSKFEETKK